MKALLLIDRGSREPGVKQELKKICSIAKYKTGYDYATYCFLEVVPPFIEEGIKKSLKHNPKILLLAPYFLHEGAHIKYDIVREVKEALHKYDFKNAYLGRHLGIDEKLINIVVERVKEVEKRIAKL